MQVRYTDLLAMLSTELGVAVYPQKFGHWCGCLKISGREGWYDSEDYVALKAIGVAFTRHKYRGQRAVDYAISRVEQWRLTQTN
jgi:hypothetical protein